MVCARWVVDSLEMERRSGLPKTLLWGGPLGAGIGIRDLAEPSPSVRCWVEAFATVALALSGALLAWSGLCDSGFFGWATVRVLCGQLARGLDVK